MAAVIPNNTKKAIIGKTAAIDGSAAAVSENPKMVEIMKNPTKNTPKEINAAI
jgi:hypothetical protein